MIIEVEQLVFDFLKEKLKEYNRLKDFLGINPLLEDLSKKYFLIDTNIEIPYN